MRGELLLDSVELYYINDIRRPRNQTGVRWSRKIRRQIAGEKALERFWTAMQIVILNLLLKRRVRK